MGFSLLMSGVSKSAIESKVRPAAEILGLTNLLDRYPRQLSGGQRQRVAMGRAIVRNPQVFLFDEPLSNLDAKLRVQMRLELTRLRRQLRATLIYVTHDQVEAMTLADRIAVLSGGHKMQYDTPDAIYNRPAALFVAGFTGAPPMNLAPCTLAGGSADLGGLRVPLPAALAERAGRRDRATFGVRPENLRLVPGGAGDIVLAADVALLEPLGAETLVTFRLGHAEMVARCPAAFREAPGTRLPLHLAPSDLHLFDTQTGVAL
jgi:multiple sugar transport system ATP-binding protein